MMNARRLFVGVVAAVLWAAPAYSGESLLSFDDLALSNATRSVTGEDLRLACLRREVPAGSINLRRTKCRYTIGAALDALDAVETLHPSARIYCPRVRPVPWEDAADVFVTWANAHRDKLRAPSVWPLMEALRGAYPCDERGS